MNSLWLHTNNYFWLYVLVRLVFSIGKFLAVGFISIKENKQRE